MVGSTLHFGIGQDAVTTTPLQMAHIAALIANNGIAYRPHVVRSLVETDLERAEVPIKPEVMVDKTALGSFWQLERQAMEAVTSFGTARDAGSPIAGGWAGKTGSTQDSRFRQPHAWFIGYAPRENPRIAFAIIMEGAGHGGKVAAPVASQLVRRWFEFSSRPVSADPSSLAAFLKSSASVSRLAMR
jgi:penicillin-binding protein 2